jgi:hypothetical protein
MMSQAQDMGIDQNNEKRKPGPKVAQVIARLEQEGKTRHRAFLNGKVALWTVIRENARLKIAIDALRLWSSASHSDEPPDIVVVDNESEGYGPVFPRGTSHLPRKLVPGETYSATPGSSRRWQYLGDRTISGIRFGVFSSAAPAVP